MARDVALLQVKKLFKSKYFRDNVDISRLSYTQLKYIILFFRYYNSTENKITRKLQTIIKYFHPYVNYGNIKDIIQRQEDSSDYGYTIKKSIAMYGKEEGTKRFNEYRERQSYTNSLDYKSTKYGMSAVEFDEYNKNRATTLNNFIKRYGKEEGTKRFNEYRERQSYTKSESRYVDEYGKEEGTKRFNAINKRKAHNVESYKIRFPHLDEDEILKKLERVYERSKSSAFYSKQSQKLFVELDEYFKGDRVYYATKNKEFGLWREDRKKYYKYDYCNVDKRFIIEYNGDYFHANPKKYSPEDIIHFKGGLRKRACDIWRSDEIKNITAELSGFKLIVVWEKDFLESSDAVIKRILEHVRD